jgi:hypothetical protein
MQLPAPRIRFVQKATRVAVAGDSFSAAEVAMHDSRTDGWIIARDPRSRVLGSGERTR